MSAGPDVRYHDLPAEERAAALERVRAALSSAQRVRVAWAHGSFVRGGSFRDLDLGVWFDSAPSWADPGNVAHAVWIYLGRPSFAVEVHVLNDAVPVFRERVAREGRLVFERQAGDGVELWTMALSELIDQQEWLRAHGVEP